MYMWSQGAFAKPDGRDDDLLARAKAPLPKGAGVYSQVLEIFSFILF